MRKAEILNKLSEIYDHLYELSILKISAQALGIYTGRYSKTQTMEIIRRERTPREIKQMMKEYEKFRSGEA
jgi:uncharacterized membrane protein